MLRHPALRGLSEDHHDALILARRCRRIAETAPDSELEAAWRTVVNAFRDELEPHFQCEERWLLPALGASSDAARTLAQRTQAEHDALRGILRAEDPPHRHRLERFGELLRAHVQFEEREVFELAQRCLSEKQLEVISTQWPKKTPTRGGNVAITIGRRKDPGDLVDALLDCHERIRRFSGIARRLADAQGATEADIAEAAESVRRYFQEGLPHHVADEEESILPRLRGKDLDADRALETMEREHRSHEPKLARLVELCATLATTPSRHPELNAELRTLSTELAEELERHLALEEEITFPAIRRHLPEDLQRTIAEEMSRRRRSQPVS